MGIDLKRLAIGIGTGGLSEVASYAADKMAGPEQEGLLKKNAYTDPNRAANLAMIKARQDALQSQATPLAGQTAINTAGSDELRAAQMGLIGAQQARVAGTAPSVAEMQLQRGADRGMSQLAAQAASARGNVNPALLARSVLNNQATMSQQNNSDAALMRAQEQQNAEQALAGNLGNTRGQDIGLATSQAGLNQQVALANAAAQQQQQQQANALIAQYTNMGLSLDQAQFMANQDLERQRMGLVAADAGRKQQAWGTILSTAGQAVGMAATGGASAAAGGGAKLGGTSTAGAPSFNASNIS